jgi:CSLREA domain-containing protein
MSGPSSLFRLLVFILFILLIPNTLIAAQDDAASGVETATEEIPVTEAPTETEQPDTSTPPASVTVEATAEPTVEVTVEPTQAPTGEATVEPTVEVTVEPTQPPASPPVFDLTQTTFEAVTGLPLEISLSVSDDVGFARVVEDTSAALGSVTLAVSQPQETTAPFYTRVVVTYLPPADYVGLDNFTLTAIDTAGETAVVTLQVDVKAAEVTPEVTAEATEDAPMAALTFIVNSDNDDNDGVCDVTHCSLREAITLANSNPDKNTIRFNIVVNPNTGVDLTIQPESAYTIDFPVIIDGKTQPGYAGKPIIVLDGQSIPRSGTPLDEIGFNIFGGDTTIRGIVIHSFYYAAIGMTFGDGNIVENCYIGTDVTGTTALPNTNPKLTVFPGSHYGIAIALNSNNNRIGGTTAAARNIISGHLDDGVNIYESTGNLVQGNYIGTDATGTLDLGNGDAGVKLEETSGNTIGGTAAGSRNIISGNAENGVLIKESNATSIITQNNLVQSNYIGTNVTGTAAIPNDVDGVALEAAANNTIGGTSATARNLISGNAGDGVSIYSASGGNFIRGNYIGTDVTGTLDLGNGETGVKIEESDNQTLGGTSASSRNIISGNNQDGVLIRETGATPITNANNIVQGNYIGTNAAGTAALGNGVNGIFIDGARFTDIGGEVATARNLISGNGSNGIVIAGTSAQENTIQGNYIGTNATGMTVIPNAANGIFIDNATNTNIGGFLAAARNIISGNLQNGVVITGATGTSNDVINAYIGVDVTGLKPLGNGGDGVLIEDTDTHQIGAVDSRGRNVISANNRGIRVVNSNNIFLYGNFIGVDKNGAKAIGNQVGIELNSSSNNTIMGDSIGGGIPNIIGGNVDEGILITGAASTNNTVQGTLIGLTLSGSFVSNAVGILIEDASNNNIGVVSDPPKPNIISANFEGGLIITGGAGNIITANSFVQNIVDIDLGGDGVTENDNQDSDSGPNNLQNYPEITSINATGTTIQGTLNSTPDEDFRIEIFMNLQCSFSGRGEGEIYIGFADLTTNLQGDGNFTLNVEAGYVKPGYLISATARNLTTGDTSEFSECATYTTAPVKAAPKLLYPSNNGGVFTQTPVLIWNQIGQAETYSIQIDDNRDFSSPIVPLTSNGKSRLFEAPTLTDGVYYWRVRGENALGNGPFSSPFKFTVNTLTGPTLTRPANNSFTSDPTPAFSWRKQIGAAEYNLFIDDNIACDGSVYQGLTTRTSLTLPQSAALNEGTYFWCLSGLDTENNESALSSIQRFQVTLLKALLNLSSTIDPTPTFSWNPAPGTGVTYTVKLDTDPNFASPETLATGLTRTTFTPTTGLATGQIYYWRVEVSGGGWSVDTPVTWSFLLAPSRLLAPTLQTPALAATGQGATPEFTWLPATSAGSVVITYEIVIDNDPRFATPEDGEDNLSVTSFTPAGLPGATGTLYYWKVRGIYGGTIYGPWSRTFNFRK